ncbi:hypothetical protein E3N88_16079 [Mikania micrantha]|uniref:Uncharacterized protein n=1 Tax=Mikania micrantha TaxID=192012 RepID=A0A5N6NXF8_9ASTR|nr:hypothetical protein E3N88_16079 [Mikania micrantha]
MSNDLRSWFVTFPNGMIPLVEIGGVTTKGCRTQTRALTQTLALSLTPTHVTSAASRRTGMHDLRNEH